MCQSGREISYRVIFTQKELNENKISRTELFFQLININFGNTFFLLLYFSESFETSEIVANKLKNKRVNLFNSFSLIWIKTDNNKMLSIESKIKIKEFMFENPGLKTSKMRMAIKNLYDIDIQCQTLRRLKKTPIEDLRSGSKFRIKCKFMPSCPFEIKII